MYNITVDSQLLATLWDLAFLSVIRANGIACHLAHDETWCLLEFRWPKWTSRAMTNPKVLQATKINYIDITYTLSCHYWFPIFHCMILPYIQGVIMEFYLPISLYSRLYVYLCEWCTHTTYKFAEHCLVIYIANTYYITVIYMRMHNIIFTNLLYLIN